ncbi:hypothetical protein EGW08_021984 [Elysia chlorotica]|uniref:Uncharacterized protein n=1 Tax=Elysia chlorotica TaxID=188477 RepID=A0A3S0Z699_ELYCH|nr:hypothetical protein EGW08_021984 [Elysia chlorotica]
MTGSASLVFLHATGTRQSYNFLGILSSLALPAVNSSSVVAIIIILESLSIPTGGTIGLIMAMEWLNFLGILSSLALPAVNSSSVVAIIIILESLSIPTGGTIGLIMAMEWLKQSVSSWPWSGSSKSTLRVEMSKFKTLGLIMAMEWLNFLGILSSLALPAVNSSSVVAIIIILESLSIPTGGTIGLIMAMEWLNRSHHGHGVAQVSPRFVLKCLKFKTVGLIMAMEWLHDRTRTSSNCLSHIMCVLTTWRLCRKDFPPASHSTDSEDTVASV